MAGNQVPLISLVDVDAKTGAVLPLQIALSVAKEGKTFCVIVSVNEVVVAHCPPFGVKV